MQRTGDDSVIGNLRSIDPRDRRESQAQLAQNPEFMRDVFQRLLQPRDGRSHQIAKCQIGPLRRGEGYRFAVQYQLRVDDVAARTTRDQVMTGVSYGPGRTRRIWESLRAEEPESTARPDLSPFAPFAYVPELDMLVQAFPNDHRLPALAEVMAGPPPDLISPLLARFGPAGWQVEEWTAESIRYRVDSRATLRMRLRAKHPDLDRTDTRCFYAKIYRDDVEARHAHDTQLDLQNQLEANAARFSVATPIIYVERLRTLVQTEVPGKALLQMLRREHNVIPAVQIAARATADLHSLNLQRHHVDRKTPPRALPNRIARLESASELLSAVRPDLANELADIVSAVVVGLADVPAAPTHGDLKPDHFLFDGDRVGLLDFDFLTASDPILDVANMELHLAKVQSKAVGPLASAEMFARAFVQEYFAHAPKDGQTRLPLYRAMASISEVARSRQGSDPQLRDRIEDCVRQAQRALTANDRESDA